MSQQPPQSNLPDDEYVPEDDAVIGQAFKWSLVAFVVIGIVVASVVVYMNWQPLIEEEVLIKDAGEIRDLDREVDILPIVRFTDITESAGIDYIHFDGSTGEKLLPETMGSGVAFFDANNNGHQDILFVSGTNWPHDPPVGDDHSSLRLYLNDGTGQYSESTQAAGLHTQLYGMGVAVGDHNNDGNVDVFITAVGPNYFFVNHGGTFTDATDSAGLEGGEREWSTSAGFFDSDNNGLLDLFVCNYVQWSRDIDIELNFTLNGRDRAYGPPTNYRGAQSYLYRNNGDGTFDDVSEAAGIHVNNPATGQPMGKALALAFADVDGDGYLDIFIANDTTQNFLFHNQGDGSFREIGSRAGVAFASNGQATGAMGIDAAHFRNDEAIAIGIGNFSNEMTSFYVQQTSRDRDGEGTRRIHFSDDAIVEGIGSPTRLALSFGLFFFDYDLDGRLDMLQANGHLEDEINQIQSSQHYRQPAQLFWNAGPDRRSCYIEVPAESLGDLPKPIVGRGAAYADIDGDGDLDVLLTQINGPPLLLRNEQNLGNNWLRIKLIGTQSNRDAIGAVVELTTPGTPGADSITQRQTVMPTRSYLSQVELPLTFGLGEHDTVDRLRIHWPSGQVQEVQVDEVNVQLEVTEQGLSYQTDRPS
jgi:hypothetical protein